MRVLPNTLVLEFSDGEEVISGIENALKEHEVEYGVFASGEGELREFDLISDSFKPPRNPGKVPFIVTAVSGKVFKKKGDSHGINFHLTLFRKGAKTEPFSGVLKRGIVNNNLRLSINLSKVGKIIEG